MVVHWATIIMQCRCRKSHFPPIKSLPSTRMGAKRKWLSRCLHQQNRNGFDIESIGIGTIVCARIPTSSSKHLNTIWMARIVWNGTSIREPKVYPFIPTECAFWRRIKFCCLRDIAFILLTCRHFIMPAIYTLPWNFSTHIACHASAWCSCVESRRPIQCIFYLLNCAWRFSVEVLMWPAAILPFNRLSSLVYLRTKYISSSSINNHALVNMKMTIVFTQFVLVQHAQPMTGGRSCLTRPLLTIQSLWNYRGAFTLTDSFNSLSFSIHKFTNRTINFCWISFIINSYLRFIRWPALMGCAQWGKCHLLHLSTALHSKCRL